MFRLFNAEFYITRKHELYLACFYAIVCAGLVQWGNTSENRDVVQKIHVFLTTLWAGFVLGVSLMEAWVKFKAPLLLKHVRK